MKALLVCLFLFSHLTFSTDFSLCKSFIQKSRLKEYIKIDDSGKVMRQKLNATFEEVNPKIIVITDKYNDSKSPGSLIHTNTILVKKMGSEGRKITILHQLLDIKKDMKGISQTVYNFDFKRIKGKCYPSEVSITVGSGARTSPDSNLGVSLKTTYNTEVCRTIKDFLDENPEIETSVNPNKLKELLRAVDNTSRLLRIDKEVFNKVHENLEDRDILVKAARGELRSCMSNHLEETINDNYLWSQKGPGTSAGDLPSAVEE